VAVTFFPAKAIVIAAAVDKVAIVGTDLGRGPTEAMMMIIRREIADKAGIRHVLISGSHSHHGPVIELIDEPGLGKGKFDAAVAYSQELPHLLVPAILDADKDLKPARIEVAIESVGLNRNRHTKREPKATDPMLAVIRFDDQAGKPIAVLVNFAAHPVMTGEKLLRYSADYPGFLKRKVEAELSTRCIFMQGAAGDLSPNPGAGPWEPKSFGQTVADHVIALARSIKTETPPHPSIRGMVDTFHFKTRDLRDPRVAGVFERSYFPEITRTYVKLYGESLAAELNTVLLNAEIALVGGLGRVLLQPCEPAQGAVVRQAHPLLRLLQRPRDVFPHHRGCLGRGLRCRPRRFAGRDRGRGADDGQGVAQHLYLAGEIRAGTTIAGTELDLGCHGSRISQLEEHRLL